MQMSSLGYKCLYMQILALPSCCCVDSFGCILFVAQYLLYLFVVVTCTLHLNMNMSSIRYTVALIAFVRPTCLPFGLCVNKAHFCAACRV